MIAALWTKLNWKRFWMTAAVVFAWVFVSDMVIHGWWLGDVYKTTSHLWRTETEMQSFMSWMMMSQALMSLMFAFIFTKGFENKGWQEGVRYGLLIALVNTAHILMQYSVTPITTQILWSWIGAGFVQCIGAGVIASKVYKK